MNAGKLKINTAIKQSKIIIKAKVSICLLLVFMI